jgi:hypothetical protein
MADLNSDEIRSILHSMNEDDDIIITNESDHDTDISSNVGGDFEEIVLEELGVNSFEIEEVVEESRANDIDDDETEDTTETGEWREWVSVDRQFSKFKWTQVNGFKPPVGEKSQCPLDYFKLFFSDELINEIVNESNKYAREKILKNTPLQKRSMWYSWKDITLEELKAFFGLIINMGLNEKSELDEYFSTDWAAYSPFFKDVFSKVRFLQIFWNLHICSPPSGPIAGTFTRSGKVRNVLSYLDKKFREYYVPENKVSVDESTVGFKGKVSFKVYNKDKPTRWGMKVFVLSESKTGYICAMEPYFGKSTTDRMDRQDLGVTSRIVLHLVSKLKQTYGDVEGLHVFTDRFYTNLDLAEALYNWKVHLTGTIMTTRKGLPELVRPKRKNATVTTPRLKLKKGDIKCFRKNDRFSLLLWKDTNLVTMLTTLYDNSTQTITRIQKGGETEQVKKPTVVCKYNKYMGGVDLADQYISSYCFSRKSIKWWRKMFFWLLETAVVNSFTLYNMNQVKKVRQLKFRKMLVEELVGNVRNSGKRGKPTVSVNEERLDGKLHLPFPLEDRKTKDCAVCSDRRPGKERKRSKFYCKTCSINPGLHMGECFAKYHTETQFK